MSEHMNSRKAAGMVINDAYDKIDQLRAALAERDQRIAELERERDEQRSKQG